MNIFVSTFSSVAIWIFFTDLNSRSVCIILKPVLVFTHCDWVTFLWLRCNFLPPVPTGPPVLRVNQVYENVPLTACISMRALIAFFFILILWEFHLWQCNRMSPISLHIQLCCFWGVRTYNQGGAKENWSNHFQSDICVLHR